MAWSWRLQANSINGDGGVGLQILVHDGHHPSSGKEHYSCVISKSVARWWIEPVVATGHPRPAAGQDSRFLQACRLCHKKLSPENDVYMYRGDQAYCSMDCRHKQIFIDDMNEGEALLARRRNSSATTPSHRPCNASAAKPHRRRGIWVAA